MKKNLSRYSILFFCLIFILSACSSNQASEGSITALFTEVNPAPLSVEDSESRVEMAQKIREIILTFDDLYDSAIVLGKEDCLVAIKVRHTKRFRMKKIEKELKETLEKEFPNENFTVSSDYKIFLEAVRLKDKVKEENWPVDKREEQLQKIIKLSREQT
ncbi:YhcN/YlaJ family sporulation lipoprotein [Pallidibacillus pasinlerensis]|uniref:Sporulation protein n=1 Tax=Pallidibacillus pasinlerensis TaxID=2703818 RepID=A0ABX0A6A4_9BACI|nr:YhcN/YlaJ family sporulation lipoprotein [Pallidibacillus pasinlerensis]NCU18926.1 sporulation protein [Pallidibacillus pasinlerensis]